MELSLARDIMTGKELIDNLTTIRAEAIMLLMGARFDSEDDITCLECGLLNECCTCHENEEN